MSSRFTFTKEKLDECFKELGKAYRKRSGKQTPAEIVLIGGASVLINYGFRKMTDDADAIIEASSIMKEAINTVGDHLGLPHNWLNTDFMKTESYSYKLQEVSKYYRQFSNILTIRTVDSEYLIAMKLMSGRIYKYDLSDIVIKIADRLSPMLFANIVNEFPPELLSDEKKEVIAHFLTEKRKLICEIFEEVE